MQGGPGKDSALRYPAGCIVLKVFQEQNQLSFMEVYHSKEGKSMYVRSSLIGPKFERGKKLDKNSFPAWYMPNMYDASELSTYGGKIKLFVIAKKLQ